MRDIQHQGAGTIKPILIITHPNGQPPSVFWASDAHVIATSFRLDDPLFLGFEDVWERYVDRLDEAWWFASLDEAKRWAERYDGEAWLAIRAGIAKAGDLPPNDLALAGE